MPTFLRSPDLSLEKGIDFSVPSVYLGQGQNYPQNMQLYRGEMVKRFGKSVLGGVTLGAHKILHLDTFKLTTGTERLIRMTKFNVQRYLAASSAWENITGADLSGTETDFFQSTICSELDLFIFSNFVDNIRKYSDSGDTVDLGGNPPKAKALCWFSPYLLIGNLLSGGQAIPQMVQWPDTGDPENWTSGNSGSQLLADEPSAIQSIRRLLNYAMVYKEGSVYRGRQVGGASIFDFGGGPFVSGKGIIAPRAVASDGQNDYYMGRFDFHRNNTVRVEDFGQPVREYIFNRLNRGRVDTCFAMHVEIFKEIWFFITVGGLDWPSEVWKYNYERGFWYFDTVLNCLSATNYKQTVDLTWNTAVGSWDEQRRFWDEQSGLTDAPLQVFGHDDGFVDFSNPNLSNDRGIAVDARIDTRDYTGIVHKGIEYDTRWLQFSAFIRGSGKAKLYYSLDYGSSWVFVEEQELEATTKKHDWFIDFIAPHVRFRLQCDGVGQHMTVRSLSPYFKDQPESLRA